jgi:hypothetical protein
LIVVSEPKKINTGANWISKTVKAAFTSITVNNLSPNTAYKWKVRSICDNESSDYSSAAFFTTSLKPENETEKEISLDVYPNPFSSQAIIFFSIEEGGHTTLEALDLAGRKVQTILNTTLAAGPHEATIAGDLLNEGIYFLKLTINGKTTIAKAVAE